MKAGRPILENPEVLDYLFSCKVEKLVVTYTLDLQLTLHFGKCCEFFELPTQSVSGRDVTEEALAVGVWPLCLGWAPKRFERRVFPGCPFALPYPCFNLGRPGSKSDEVIVFEPERWACDFVGPYFYKEHESAENVLRHKGQDNRHLFVMAVEVEVRQKPDQPSKRSREPENIGTDVPVPAKR